MSAGDLSAFDHHMMRVALAMARRGLGTAAPNPAVGAVVADEATGELIARGWTQPGGRPHAEPEALRRAGERARGATLYVTLEPCAHFGKTPPCADAIIAAGVRRVVIGVGDPDPRTRGDGIARLKAAGIAVEVGLDAEEARWVTLGHILRVTERRPFVQLKMALAADGTVPRGANGRPLMVTGAAARAYGHRLRAEWRRHGARRRSGADLPPAGPGGAVAGARAAVAGAGPSGRPQAGADGARRADVDLHWRGCIG
jgi:diaminohydroxyphosphoribosylaminopyrimidine deaminase/5-amino-6-(5-phosphoribosylamino)uracil reductase